MCMRLLRLPWHSCAFTWKLSSVRENGNIPSGQYNDSNSLIQDSVFDLCSPFSIAFGHEAFDLRQCHDIRSTTSITAIPTAVHLNVDRSNFSDLPRELRDMIYEQYIFNAIDCHRKAVPSTIRLTTAAPLLLSNQEEGVQLAEAGISSHLHDPQHSTTVPRKQTRLSSR